VRAEGKKRRITIKEEKEKEKQWSSRKTEKGAEVRMSRLEWFDIFQNCALKINK